VKPMTYSNVDPGLFEAVATGHPPSAQQQPHNLPAPPNMPNGPTAGQGSSS
jgi:hypothetical protein